MLKNIKWQDIAVVALFCSVMFVGQDAQSSVPADNAKAATKSSQCKSPCRLDSQSVMDSDRQYAMERLKKIELEQSLQPQSKSQFNN